MKKIIALALSLIMVLTCAAALAEAPAAEKESLKVIGAFEIKYSKLENDYKLTIVQQDDMSLFASILSEQEAMPIMVLSIAFNDSWADVERLNDVDEDGLNAIKATFEEQAEGVEFDTTETAYGTKLLVAKADGGALVAIYTIYKGHEIEIDMFPGAGVEAITDADIGRVVNFLSDMDFVPVEK